MIILATKILLIVLFLKKIKFMISPLGNISLIKLLAKRIITDYIFNIKSITGNNVHFTHYKWKIVRIISYYKKCISDRIFIREYQ